MHLLGMNARPSLSILFVETVNNSSMAHVVIHILANADVNLNDSLVFISDNAAHVTGCFTNVLLGLLTNAVHIICWAHIFSLVGEHFCAALELTDMSVASMKVIFSKVPA
jgi:hypothetical protein